MGKSTHRGNSNHHNPPDLMQPLEDSRLWCSPRILQEWAPSLLKMGGGPLLTLLLRSNVWGVSRLARLHCALHQA